MQREQLAKQSSVSAPKSGQLKYWKRVMARTERRKAKLNPECTPEYKKYHGYRI